MYTISTYRGIANGWRTITVTDDTIKAERMFNLASRIFSAYPTRSSTADPLTFVASPAVAPRPRFNLPRYYDFADAVLAMVYGTIAGLSLCAMIKAAQFDHCQAGTSGDPARIAHCAKWLR